MTGSGCKKLLYFGVDFPGAFMAWSGSARVQDAVPECPGLLEGLAQVHPVYCFHATIDGVRCAAFFCGGRKRDALGRRDGAAAVDEFGIDLAGLGSFQRQCQSVLGIAVVRGNGVVSDEEPVADGHSEFGQGAGQCCDGCCVRLGPPEAAS
jgi:hypothetical protein